MEFNGQGVNLEHENDVAGFLVVYLEKDSETGLLETKQTGLMNSWLSPGNRIVMKLCPWLMLSMSIYRQRNGHYREINLTYGND